MTSDRINLADLRQKVTGGELGGDYLTDAEGLALVEAVEAAHACMAMFGMGDDPPERHGFYGASPVSKEDAITPLVAALARFDFEAPA